MVCAMVRGSARKVRRRWQGQKPLIFMHFHEMSFGSQHEIWSKQHNGKVSIDHFSKTRQLIPSSTAVLLSRWRNAPDFLSYGVRSNVTISSSMPNPSPPATETTI